MNHTFSEAVADLIQRFPGHEPGRSTTSKSNVYFQRAQGMTFRRVNDTVFRSTEGHGRMWVYASNGGIYAGSKRWPEFENS